MLPSSVYHDGCVVYVLCVVVFPMYVSLLLGVFVW